jgi:uncharacterized coiled-coil DUF342 family protein
MTFPQLYIIIAIASALVAGAAVWKWQANKYDVIITRMEKTYVEERNKQISEIAAANSEATKAEREGAQRVSEIESKYLSANEKLRGAQDSINKLRAKYDGLYVKSSSCSSNSSAATTASSDPAASIPNATSGVCKLSGEFTESLVATYRDADEMKSRLDACKSYAEDIVRFRKEHNEGN